MNSFSLLHCHRQCIRVAAVAYTRNFTQILVYSSGASSLMVEFGGSHAGRLSLLRPVPPAHVKQPTSWKEKKKKTVNIAPVLVPWVVLGYLALGSKQGVPW